MFKLSDNFIEKFKRKRAPFGFNGLGELVYMRTYSRIKEDGKNEMWWETVRRVVEGTYNMQKKWIESHHLGNNGGGRVLMVDGKKFHARSMNQKQKPYGRELKRRWEAKKAGAKDDGK